MTIWSFAMRNDLNGHMAASGRTLFYVAENLPYMAAYRLQGDTMQKQWECFYRTPHYKISNDAIQYDKEKATGPLKSLAADEHYVYLLYVDTLMSRYDVNTMLSVRYIMSWDIRRFSLSLPKESYWIR